MCPVKSMCWLQTIPEFRRLILPAEISKLPDDWDAFIDPETQLCPLGDMAISFERAAEQAKHFGHSLRREIGYLTIHSVLHLLGYDHMDEAEQKKQMREREEAIAATVSGVQR